MIARFPTCIGLRTWHVVRYTTSKDSSMIVNWWYAEGHLVSLAQWKRAFLCKWITSHRALGRFSRNALVQLGNVCTLLVYVKHQSASVASPLIRRQHCLFMCVRLRIWGSSTSAKWRSLSYQSLYRRIDSDSLIPLEQYADNHLYSVPTAQ